MTSKTITLSGAEIRADYGGGANAWIRNDGTAAVYASTTPGVVAGADGVVSIPTGQAAAVYGACGTVYLLGTGSVQLVAADYVACPFKVSTSAGGSDGVDEVARAELNAHETNMDIHVTAAQKTAWDGKADKSDIPDKLPADGGNADTVGGKQASDFIGGGYVYPSYTQGDIGNDLNSYTEDYHGFVYNCTNSPQDNDYGFLDVFHFSGYGFSPSSTNAGGVVLQVFTRVDNVVFTRLKYAGVWTDWRRTSDHGNADTLSGRASTDFANAYNLNIGEYLSGKSGDIRALACLLPTGGLNVSTDAVPDVTFPLTGDLLLVWSKSMYTGNDLMYGTLMVRPMAEDGDTYICSVFNGSRYTSWQKLSDGGNAASVGVYTEEKIAALEARIAALEGGT